MHKNKGKNKGQSNSKQGPQSPTLGEEKLPDKKTSVGTNDCDNEKKVREYIKNDKWTIANKIASAQAIINLVLMIVTGLLFWRATQQTTAAQEAVKVAENNTQAQINALKEQFEIGNRPYLSVKGLTTFVFTPDKKISFNYEIDNLGQYPVKMDSLKSGIAFAFDGAIPTIEKYISSQEAKEMNNYITKDFPFRGVFTARSGLTDSEISKIKSGLVKCFWFAEIKYIDQINKKPWMYTYALTFDSPAFKEFELIVNKNDPIPIIKN